MLLSVHFIVACLNVFTVCVCHAELNSYLLTYLLALRSGLQNSQYPQGTLR